MPSRKLHWKLTTSSGVFTDGALSEIVKREMGRILKFEVFKGKTLILVADYSQGIIRSPVGTYGFDPNIDQPRFFKRRQCVIAGGKAGSIDEAIKTTVCFGVGTRLFCEGGDFFVWQEPAR